MITSFILAALAQAKYEILPDDKSVYAEIPGIPGVWANAKTFEECRRELQEVLEEWIVRRLRSGSALPKFNTKTNLKKIHKPVLV